jgi:NTP pyrophosphatase (non-canonical NTP hydrolase)
MQEIMERLIKFRDDRKWGKHHTPEELARAIGIEAAELNELFLWERDYHRQEVREEVADVMIYCLNLCEIMGFDPVKIINEKIDMNEVKYPA